MFEKNDDKILKEYVSGVLEGTETPFFLDPHLSIANGFVSSKIFDKGAVTLILIYIVNWCRSSLCFLWCIHIFRNLLGLLGCNHVTDFHA